jgi:hypothetical protein
MPPIPSVYVWRLVPEVGPAGGQVAVVVVGETGTGEGAAVRFLSLLFFH